MGLARNHHYSFASFITPQLPSPARRTRCKVLICSQRNTNQLWGRVKKAIPLSKAFADRYGEGVLIPTSSNSYKLVCPFHNDKNPSLNISDDLASFHCFGCGASGTIIDLEQLASGHRSIAHALKSLASTYKPIAEVLRTSSFSSPKGDPDTEQSSAVTERPPLPKIPRRVIVTHKAICYDVLRDVTLLYQRALWDNSSAIGLQYLMKERKLSKPTLRAFACGFAPPSTQADFLQRSLSHPPEHLAIAGVVRSPREGVFFDRFRDRIITPIRDLHGKPIALAGRALPNAPDTVPKYINCSETTLFKKKRTLFGADMAKDAPSAKANYGYIVVVEGYMDVMAMFERTQGRIACVATMGTGVSLEQLHSAYDLLEDCVNGKVIVNFDNDEAGIKALNRICESVLCGAACAHAVYVAFPPSPTKDADEFMRDAGTPEEYISYLLEAARPWYEWYGGRIVKQEVDRLTDPENSGDVEEELNLTAEDMAAVGFSQPAGKKTFFLSELLRQQRDDMLISFGAQSDSFEISESDEPKRATCSRKVLDDLAALLNSANRTLPGLNAPALVLSWADKLSIVEPTKLMRIYAYVFKKYRELSKPWRNFSVPVNVQWMPTPPWITEELAKTNTKLSKKNPDDKASEIEYLNTNPKEVKRSRDRHNFQEAYILPELRKRRCSSSMNTKVAPRRSAEEQILRTLIFAKEIDRIDALEILISAIIRCAQKQLPFWTSQKRESLFKYLSGLEGDIGAFEIAAYLEECEWWCPEIEELFIPVEEESDPEWAEFRQLEIKEPVEMVRTSAYSVESMAGMVASRQALDEAGDVLQRLQTKKEGEKEGEELISRIVALQKDIDRSKYLNPAELEEREQNAINFKEESIINKLKAKLIEDVESGKFDGSEGTDNEMIEEFLKRLEI